VSLDEAAFHGELRLPSWVISGSPDAARQILSSLAGALITVVGVVFSVVIVAMTLASQQFGPRMLRTFIRDRGDLSSAIDAEAAPGSAGGSPAASRSLGGAAPVNGPSAEVLLARLDRSGSVVKGHPMATVWPPEAATAIGRRLETVHITGPLRTLSQDIAFGIDQLVEIGIRALSPAVNDTFTALTCIDWLGDSLCKIAVE